MSHIDPGPLAAYDSLSDPNLTSYFSNSRMRKHLVRSGLVTRRGEIVSEKVFRLNNARKEHQRHVRDLLAQAIVHKALDMERHRQMKIKKQLEEIGKYERVRRVRADRALRGDEDILPLLSPTSKPQKKKQQDQYQSVHAEAPRKMDQHGFTGPTGPGQMPPSVGYPVVPGDAPYNTRSSRIKTAYPKVEIDNQHLYQLDHEALRSFTLNLTNYDLGSGVSPYTVPVLDPASREVLAATKQKTRKEKKHPREKRGPKYTGRVMKPTKSSSARSTQSAHLHRREPPMIHRNQPRSNCLITFKYLGQIVQLDCEKEDPRDEVSVYQQHCGGENLCIYSGKVLAGETFTIVSQRHRGFPFSLTFYLNGIQAERLSTCCEYKHKVGYKLGSKSSYFGFKKIEGAYPCYKCMISQGKLKTVEKEKVAKPPSSAAPRLVRRRQRPGPKRSSSSENSVEKQENDDDNYSSSFSSSSDESSDVSSVSSLTESDAAPKQTKNDKPLNRAKSPPQAKSPERAKSPVQAKTPERAKSPEAGKSRDKAKSPEPSKSPKRVKSPEPEKSREKAKSPEPVKREKAKSPEPAKRGKAKSPEPAKSPVQLRKPEVLPDSSLSPSSEKGFSPVTVSDASKSSRSSSSSSSESSDSGDKPTLSEKKHEIDAHRKKPDSPSVQKKSQGKSSSSSGSGSSYSESEDEQSKNQPAQEVHGSIKKYLQEEDEVKLSNMSLNTEQARELVFAIKSGDIHPSVRALSLDNLAVSGQVIGDILDALRDCSAKIKHLSMRHNHISGGFVKKLLALIKHHPLETLVLDGNPLTDNDMEELMEGLSALVKKNSREMKEQQAARHLVKDAIRTSTSEISSEHGQHRKDSNSSNELELSRPIREFPLATLSLNNTRIGARGTKSIAAFLALNPALKSLHLNGSLLTTTGVLSLWQELSSGRNRTLEKLYLGHNQFADSGISQLCSYDISNSALRFVDFTDNGITEDGGKHLVKFVTANKSIKSLKLSRGNRIKHKTLKQIRKILVGRSKD